MSVKLFSILKVITGKNELEMEVGSVKEIYDTLIEKYGDVMRKSLMDQKGRILDFLQIFINGTVSKNLDAPLRDGDEVEIIPPVEGGVKLTLPDFEYVRFESLSEALNFL